MTTRSTTFPDHRHSSVPYIDLRRSLPTLRSSLSPAVKPETAPEPAQRIAMRHEADEAARGMRRLFLLTLLFWGALLAWYLHASHS